ncbi:MAG: hypothetical protein LBS76_03615 [Mycoplasmataceae bacterium]|jgi:aspartyl/glutamyl-tRNA(Asn/Gln) amidotransferase C subunit|nr:hypothetical protein [Mycoplasmataceae bacterium]
MKINKEELKNLALSLHFQLDDEQLEKLYEESDVLLTSLEKLSDFNVDNLEPMYYPINHTHHTLREDKPIAVQNPDSYLSGAQNRKGKYVVVK